MRPDAPAPADGLLHPITLGALGLLLLNDHVLKAAWPGPVTGKLSDLAGLAFFPILLLGGWELILALSGRWRGPTGRALTMAVATTSAAFTLVKTVPAAAEQAGSILGLAQWLLSLPIRVLGATGIPPVTRGILVVDPTDLLALPALILALSVGVGRVRKVRPWNRNSVAAQATQ